MVVYPATTTPAPKISPSLQGNVPAASVPSGPGTVFSDGGCSPCYGAFAIMRSAPIINFQQPDSSIVWWALIVGTPGKIPDSVNAIDVSTYQTSIVSPVIDGVTITGLIVDSTAMLIRNNISNSITSLRQEDAFQLFANTSTLASGVVMDGCKKPNIPCPDGHLQFMALLSISPSCTWNGMGGGSGLIVTLTPLANNSAYAGSTYGNWCPLAFSIGQCGTQTACASLLYLTCHSPTGYASYLTGYSYHANYANVRFTLLNKCKVAVGGFRKAFYIAVESLDRLNFLVFFGQQRLLGVANIIIVSPVMDIRCAMWQPVLIITMNTPLALNCANVVN